MTEEVLRKLYDTAYTLTRNATRPIDVGKICARLGIQVNRGSGSRKRAFLLQTGDTTQIVIPESMPKDKVSPWERFLIAHELGHYFLSELRVPKPLGSREYWETEKICDTFARRLLLPTNEVAAVVSITRTSATELLGATLHLHVTWDVPWPVAAHEVSECARTVYFLRVVTDEHRFRVSVSTLPDKRQTGRFIPPESSLGQLLLRLPHHGGRPQAVPAKSLPSLEPLGAVADAAVCRAGRNEYRVAAVVS